MFEFGLRRNREVDGSLPCTDGFPEVHYWPLRGRRPVRRWLARNFPLEESGRRHGVAIRQLEHRIGRLVEVDVRPLATASHYAERRLVPAQCAIQLIEDRLNLRLVLVPD